MADDVRRRSKAWVLALSGGAAVIVGSLLAWLDTGGVTVGTDTVTGRPTGLDLTYGMVALGAGIAAALFGFLMLVWPRPTRLWGVGAFLGGGTALAMAIVTIATVRDTYISFVGSELGRATEEIEHSLGALFDNGGLAEEVAIGVYVVIAGGVVALLGGFIAMLRGRPTVERASEASVTPSGVGTAPVIVPLEEPVEPQPTTGTMEGPTGPEELGAEEPPSEVAESAEPPAPEAPVEPPPTELESTTTLPEPPEPPERPEEKTLPPDVEQWR